MSNPEPYTTLPYKRLADGTDILLDFYPPQANPTNPKKVPAVVYFHGGGLTFGDRQTFLPFWLQKRLSALGAAFISADYRLLIPINCHHIIEDVKDVFKFITTNPVIHNGTPFEIDSENIAVSGSSAGGLLAYLAGIHCDSPKPKAVFSLYGMGGNYLISNYLQPKDKAYIMGQPLLDTTEHQHLLYPHHEDSIAPSSGTHIPLGLQPDPDTPPDPRLYIVQLYLQVGVYLDYYTGQHEPSLSAQLRESLNAGKSVEEMAQIVPEHHRALFPQLLVNSSWPPTILVHGSADTAVPVDESRYLEALLKKAGVAVKYIEVDGEEHAFDMVKPTAEADFGKVFDEVAEFLGKGFRV